MIRSCKMTLITVLIAVLGAVIHAEVKLNNLNSNDYVQYETSMSHSRSTRD